MSSGNSIIVKSFLFDISLNRNKITKYKKKKEQQMKRHGLRNKKFIEYPRRGGIKQIIRLVAGRREGICACATGERRKGKEERE